MAHISFWFMLIMLIYWGKRKNYKEKHSPLVFASNEIELEVNADKTKYTVMSRDQNAGRSNNINIDNSSFERAKKFKYLGTILANQNSIQEEIKSRLK